MQNEQQPQVPQSQQSPETPYGPQEKRRPTAYEVRQELGKRLTPYRGSRLLVDMLWETRG